MTTRTIEQCRAEISRIQGEQRQQLLDAYLAAEARLAEAHSRRAALEAARNTSGLRRVEQELHRKACDLIHAYDNRTPYRSPAVRADEYGRMPPDPERDRRVTAELKRIEERDRRMYTETRDALDTYCAAAGRRMKAEADFERHAIHAELVQLRQLRDEALAALNRAATSPP